MNIFKKTLNLFAKRKLKKDRENFMTCIVANDIEGIEIYLKNGLDPNFGPQNLNYFYAMTELPPLFAAAKMIHPEMVKMLLDHKTDPHRALTEGNELGWSPPIASCQPKHVLQHFVEYIERIDSRHSPPHHIHYPFSPERALQVYKMLRSTLGLTDNCEKIIAAGTGPSLQLFAAWEQKQTLHTAVHNSELASSPRRRI